MDVSGRSGKFGRSRPYRLIWSLLLLAAGSITLSAQSIQWTEFSDLPDSLRKEIRPLLIFMHTDWCRYCALQDHNTFGDEKVARQINERFYALRLNAESDQPISFLNRIYRGAGNQYHELAEFLTGNQQQVVFPTTIILSKNWTVEQRWTGFVNKETVLEFMANSRSTRF